MTSDVHSDGLPKLIKVLLVDDVELVIELEKTFFQRDRFKIFMARTGEDALRLVTEEKPDLVFLDLYLPGMNGDAVCRQLKTNAETVDIPIIMVVQLGNQADVELCRAVCCDDILFKPVRRRDFLRVSREQLSFPERLAPRFSTRLLVHYGLREERLFQKYTSNVGAGGLFLVTDTHLSIDTLLNLKIDLPDGQDPIRCHGRVAWLNHPDWIKKPKLPHGMGVEFVDIEDVQLQRLIAHLSQG